MGIIPALVILLFCGIIFAQEDCHKACSNQYNDDTKNRGCKEGCHLASVFTILHSVEPLSKMQTKCQAGCAEVYSKEVEVKEACQFGCQNQRGRNSGSVTLTEKDPIIGVVRREMNEEMRSSFFNFWPFRRYNSDFSGVEETINQMRALHENIIRQIESIHHTYRMLRPSHHESNEVAVERPHGHFANSLTGPEVNNKDSNSEEIINVQPVKHKVFVKVYGHPNHYEVSTLRRPVDEASFVERLSQRARRMSILSQWLICIALLLCLLSMVGISLTIIRQIKLQQRLRARQTHVVIPTSLGQPLPAKKIPLESPAAAMDYPLIHDTPPPAYDQLSMHKEKLQESQQP